MRNDKLSYFVTAFLALATPPALAATSESEISKIKPFRILTPTAWYPQTVERYTAGVEGADKCIKEDESLKKVRLDVASMTLDVTDDEEKIIVKNYDLKLPDITTDPAFDQYRDGKNEFFKQLSLKYDFRTLSLNINFRAEYVLRENNGIAIIADAPYTHLKYSLNEMKEPELSKLLKVWSCIRVNGLLVPLPVKKDPNNPLRDLDPLTPR